MFSFSGFAGARRYLRRAGAISFVLLVVAGLAAAGASACNPGRNLNSSYYFFNGSNTGPTFDSGRCIIGSSADIQVRNPYVQAGFSAAWTALFDGATGEIIQAGWWNITPNYTRQNFAEWVLPTGHIQQMKTWAPASVGSGPNYEVLYSGNTFHIDYNTTNYYNWSDPGWAGCWAQNYAEINDNNTQFPGVPSDHETYLPGLSVEFSSGGGWQLINSSNWIHTYLVESGFNNNPSPAIDCVEPGAADASFDTYNGSINGTFPGDSQACAGGTNGLSLANGIHFGGSDTTSPNYYTDQWDMCQ